MHAKRLRRFCKTALMTGEAMINTKQTNPDSHIMELLPWYVNGSLSASEKAEVDVYLATHPEFFKEIELLQIIQNTTEKRIDIPVPDTSQLMQKLDEIKQSEERSFSYKANQFLAWLFSPNAAWTAVPIALALAIVLLWIPNQTSQNGDFRTLSSDETSATLTISVATLNADNAGMLIDKIHKLAPTAKITAEADNQFVIFLSDEIEPEEAMKLLNNIQSLPVVKSAEMITTQ